MNKIYLKDFAQQGKEIESLQNQIEENRFVHAVLITGESGTGKKTLASILAKALLCTENHGLSCDKCESCVLFDAGEHPDLIIIKRGEPLSSETKKGRSTIPVSDIREMKKLCSRYSFNGHNRVVIIPDAEDLTIQAQNSLLKILEEPPENTFFILTSGKPSELLITIRSRCRSVKLKPWSDDYIFQILVQSGIPYEKAKQAVSSSSGSIGKALLLTDDETYWEKRKEIIDAFFRSSQRGGILRISAAWKDRREDAGLLFDVLENALHKLLKIRFGKAMPIEDPEFPSSWINFAYHAGIEQFSFLNDRINEARRQNSFNVNFQAVFEQLLLSFIGECEKWGK